MYLSLSRQFFSLLLNQTVRLINTFVTSDHWLLRAGCPSISTSVKYQVYTIVTRRSFPVKPVFSFSFWAVASMYQCLGWRASARGERDSDRGRNERLTSKRGRCIVAGPLLGPKVGLASQAPPPALTLGEDDRRTFRPTSQTGTKEPGSLGPEATAVRRPDRRTYSNISHPRPWPTTERYNQSRQFLLDNF